jgi:hypothetical protein
MFSAHLLNNPSAWRWLAAFILTFCTLSFRAAQHSQEQLPTVISAGDPTYPLMARRVFIQGTVLLRITTDGTQVSQVQIESGPAMLAIAAQENVKTWRFQAHNPISFETTFRYTLLPDLIDCLPIVQSDKGTVLLNLPREVDLTAKRIGVCETPVDYTKPAIVEFKVILNGKKTTQPNQIMFTIGKHSIQIPLQDGRIEVPPEVLQSNSVGFSMNMLGEEIRFQEIFGGKFTEGPLTLILADKRFPSDYRRANKGGAKSNCVLLFEGGEPGTILIEWKCRTMNKN